MRWYAGADHAGYRLKNGLVALLREWGDEVVDFGTNSDGSVDYPDFAEEVGRAVASSEGATLGLLCCGSGIGVSIAANKVRGVRAALVTEPFSAGLARKHNNANVVCFGERLVGLGLAGEALRAFRDAAFEAGRHEKRVEKITALEVP